VLREEFVRQGNWLFRWRSYLPLVLVAPMVAAMQGFGCRGQDICTHQGWTFVCLAISLAGLGLRVLTLGHAAPGTSGRNTREGQVAKFLNTTGMYSVVRHPLYLGNFVTGLGIALYFSSWWFTAIYVLAFWLYYERIMLAEEEFLQNKFGKEYAAWAMATPAFVPKPCLWRRPSLPFSLRTVVRSEYSTFFLIIASFFALEVTDHLLMKHATLFDPLLTAGFLTGAVLYLTVRTVKRRTTVLRPRGSTAKPRQSQPDGGGDSGDTACAIPPTSTLASGQSLQHWD
jgi:protein-S-isoprenylcysteine O-methyltransferase Ste14